MKIIDDRVKNNRSKNLTEMMPKIDVNKYYHTLLELRPFCVLLNELCVSPVSVTLRQLR